MRKKVKLLKNGLGNTKFKLTISLAVFYFIFLALNFIFGNKGYFKIRELKEKKKEISLEIEKIRKENEKLSQELIAAKTNPFWVEKVAREELDLVKDGEIVFKFSKEAGER